MSGADPSGQPSAPDDPGAEQGSSGCLPTADIRQALAAQIIDELTMILALQPPGGWKRARRQRNAGRLPQRPTEANALT